MAPPNNFRIARVTMVFNRDTRVFNNSWHVYRSVGWVPADLVTIATAFYNWWTAAYKACVPTATLLTNIHVQVYDPTGSPWVYDRPVSPAENGTRAGTSEAANVTLATSLRAGLAGRAYRGRYYVPGVIEADVNPNDTAISGIVTTLAVAATNLIGPALPAGFTLVIFHRFDNLFSTIVSYVVENLIDSQRRRLAGRGR